VCGRVKADIVFLVDESWSIGTNNFGKLKDFLFRTVTYFPTIGPKGTQVGDAIALAYIRLRTLQFCVFVSESIVSIICSKHQTSNDLCVE